MYIVFASKRFADSESVCVQVILFSDILTPLTGMNIPFDILKTKGPIIHNPIRTAADVAQVRELVPGEAVPYVGEALTALRSEVILITSQSTSFWISGTEYSNEIEASHN